MESNSIYVTLPAWTNKDFDGTQLNALPILPASIQRLVVQQIKAHDDIVHERHQHLLLDRSVVVTNLLLSYSAS